MDLKGVLNTQPNNLKTLNPGETLTVLLLTNDGTEQVEVRVTEKGDPQIFNDNYNTISFDDWFPLKGR